MVHQNNQDQRFLGINQLRADGRKYLDVSELINTRISVQQMVIREVGMDEHSKDVQSLGYHDRIKKLRSAQDFQDICFNFWQRGELGLESWALNAPDQQVLQFGQAIANLLDEPRKLIGFRIIRHTNVATGYPVFELEGVFRPD
ncbi:MAG: hypothetical protein ACK5Y6_07910 [Pseudomonadota bacterium]